MPDLTYATLDVEEKDTVATPSIAYREMAVRWPKLHSLLGGTPAMRKAAEEYLPRGHKEHPELYKLKLRMAYLYNAYRSTVRRVVAKPFSRPVVLKAEEDLPDRLQVFPKDMDAAGTDCTQFLRNLMAAGVIYGLTHILVDFSNVDPDLTAFDEVRVGARARFVHVLPTQLIGWWPDTGAPKEIRIQEFVKERKGNYGERVVEQIRVYRTDSWEIYRKKKETEGKDEGEEKWKLHDAGLHSFGRVPLVTYYVNRVGNLVGEPPFDDLAHVNIAHWQSSADQRNILRFARVPILGLFGFDQSELQGSLTIGSAKAVRAKNPQADMRWAEHSGAAINSGDQDLSNLRDEMESLGDQPLRERSGDITATGRAIDEARVHTDIHAWVRSLEATVLEAFGLAAEWTGSTLPEEFAVQIYDNFNLLMRAEGDMAILDRARGRRDITRLTWLREAQRRNVLSQDVNAEAEDDELNNAAPELPRIGGLDDEDDEGGGGDGE